MDTGLDLSEIFLPAPCAEGVEHGPDVMLSSETFFRVVHTAVGKHITASSGAVKTTDMAIQILEFVAMSGAGAARFVKLKVASKTNLSLADWFTDPNINFELLSSSLRQWCVLPKLAFAINTQDVYATTAFDNKPSAALCHEFIESCLSAKAVTKAGPHALHLALDATAEDRHVVYYYYYYYY
jgi:hypothetical protein